MVNDGTRKNLSSLVDRSISRLMSHDNVSRKASQDAASSIIKKLFPLPRNFSSASGEKMFTVIGSLCKGKTKFNFVCNSFNSLRAK